MGKEASESRSSSRAGRGEVASNGNRCLHIRRSFHSLRHGLILGVLVGCIGVLVGCLEFTVTTILASLVNAKFSLIQSLVESNSKQWMVLLFLLPSISLISCVVVFLYPTSAGSSLPEIKGFLNGAHIPGVFSLGTTVTKALGVIGVISCGYPVGREGPMVQLGAAVASQVMKVPLFQRAFKSKRDPGMRKDAEAKIHAQEKTLFVTIGGAAGIAAAFRTPVGGVLYMMEDMASYWNHETTVSAFCCTMVATLMFSFLLDASHGINYEALVVFDDNPDKNDWKGKDVPFFAFLAIISGVLSVLYSELLFLFQRIRRDRARFKTPRAKVLEVLIFSCIICVVPLYIGNAFGCARRPSKEPHCAPNNCNVCGACCKSYLADSMDMCDLCSTVECSSSEHDEDHHGGMSLVKYTCRKDYYNDMASLWLMGEEGAIKQLYSRESMKRNVFSQGTLFAFVPLYLILAGSCGGLPLPFGTFVPNLFMGAALGRLFALVAQDTFGVTGLASPGTYALIGAGSVLGGYTRMTLTVVVMIAEASGDVSIIVPLMLSVICSRGVASFLSECYDEKMIELRRIPFLHGEASSETASDLVRSIMERAVTLRLEESATKLKKLVEGRNIHHTAFPVVDDGDHLIGLVQGLVLKRILEVYYEMEESSTVSLSMENIMDPAPYVVMETMPISKLVPLICKLQVECVVVLDSVGGVAGLVQRSALVKAGTQKIRSTRNRAISKLFNDTSHAMYEESDLYDESLRAKSNIAKLFRFLSNCSAWTLRNCPINYKNRNSTFTNLSPKNHSRENSDNYHRNDSYRNDSSSNNNAEGDMQLSKLEQKTSAKM